ncbi:RNA polymerase sigma factor [Roseateles toxinivorans]|uniref:RNA polymerase sigma-70 factor (ECF subfamily) n=1 Tax=Roseateles toxinivorans TaxID=270368 RepID=A0A4R6QNQ8_9BURK|nr:sigma-70 family RNA polymerase sigma factor [Roseateles toxinivorans]TDP72257.1 RNA polymerase sigma-70 factor (ECF subfamily) [Roseateles toxinivorans]
MNPDSKSRWRWLAANILPHEPALRAWLRRKQDLPIEADDLVQEAYATLASLNTVDHIHNPKAYLFQTAHSIALQQLRRDRVVSIVAIADVDELHLSIDTPGPEQQAASRQELRRVVEAIDSLPPQCGEVFRLRKVEGLSQREVAGHMGLAESTVEKHMGRAIRTLMDLFGRGGKPASRASRTDTDSNDEYEQRTRDQ